MKVSKREFYLLIILLCAGVGYLLYTFLYAPMISNIATASVELINSQLRLSSYQQTVANYDIAQLQKEQQARIDTIEETAKPLLPYIDDGEITAFINELAQSQNIHVYKAIFNTQEPYDTAIAADAGAAATYPLKQAADAFKGGAEGIQVPVGSDTAADSNTTAAAPPPTDQVLTVVNRVTVEIQLSSVTYPQIIGFMKQLEASGRAIYLSSMNIAEESGGNLKATLVYGFMQTDKLTDADKGLAEVTAAQSAGKSNPFGLS